MGAAGQWRWYVQRLRMMGWRELVHRVRERLGIGLLAASYLCNRFAGRRRTAPITGISRYGFCIGDTRRLPSLQWDFNPDAGPVARCLRGELRVLGHDWKWTPQPDSWRLAPDTGRLWPVCFFANIPFRPGNPVGDIRVAWEPARLQQLVTLALLVDSGSTEADAATAILARQLISWVDENPFCAGIHYVSAMECALRLIAVCHAADLARRKLADNHRFWQCVAQLAVTHALLIERRLSLYSSAGNHTLAECAGLIYAGCLFPEHPAASRWKSRGLKIFTREVARQILPDGGGIEQSTWYHLLGLDLLGLVIRLLRHQHEDVPEVLEDAHTRGCGFLAWFGARPAELLKLGDADGGFALSEYLRISWAATPSGERFAQFPDTGCSVIKIGGDAAVTAVFDHGPLGMSPCYGHGHADALAVCMAIGGRQLLLDSGTYTYSGDQAWRAYFRGTSAHNTVTVDDGDQALAAGTFIWSKPYRAELRHLKTEAGSAMCLCARHDGYADGVGIVHWRSVSVLSENEILIRDFLTGDGAGRKLCLRWHVPADAYRRAQWCVVPGIEPGLFIEIVDADVVLEKSAEHSPYGWFSPAYGCKVPAQVLQTSYSGSLPHEFVTRVSLGVPETSAAQLARELENARQWAG